MEIDDYLKTVMSVHVDSEESTLYNVLGLNGEAGEVADLFKKAMRENGRLDAEQLRSELGDVLCYLTRLAHLFGYSLNDLMEDSANKINYRKSTGWVPDAAFPLAP